jgi:hypothetical protein
MELCAVRYRRTNLLQIRVVSAAVTEQCVFEQLWFNCVRVSLVRNRCSPVKWQTLRNRQFAPSYVLTLIQQLLRLVKCWIKHFVMVPWVEYKYLNGTHVSNVTGRTSTENFERSGRLLTIRTNKNVEKARQVIHANMEGNAPKMECIVQLYLMNFHPTCTDWIHKS